MNYVPLPIPWLELAIAIAILGALIPSWVREPYRAWRLSLVLAGITHVCATVSCVGFYLCRETRTDAGFALHTAVVGQTLLDVDELNAPLLPMLGLIYFLTVLATGRTKMRRFSLRWSQASHAIRLATFGCVVPWALIALLALGTIPPYLELVKRRQPTRVYVIHMLVFVGLLALGWGLVDATATQQTFVASACLLAAILVRCGTVPAHCWITDWFEHASLGNALLYVTPLTGVYAVVRLVLPVAPDGLLQGLEVVSLITAVYAAGMALVQQDARRFFAYLFISHASLVLVGLEMHTSVSLTGALALWISVAMSLTGFGLTLRALEARYGRVSLTEFHGLYEHSPALAVCFFLSGIAAVGFPGTLGFVATELLVDGAVQASPWVGLIVALAAAMNGIAVLRAYFRIFTGTRHESTVSLNIGVRERFAVLALASLILGGGLFPQVQISSRYRAANDILERRKTGGLPEVLDETAGAPHLWGADEVLE